MGRQKKQHLTRRKDGRFCAVYKGRQFMGRTEAEAIEARDRYKALAESGMKMSGTVKEFGLHWLPVSHPKSSVSDSTYTGLAIHLEKLIRQIGDLPLDKVTPLDIKDTFTREYDGLSNSYIKAARQLFCALFDAAVENGYCRSNPVRNRSARPHKGTIGGHRSITEQERRWIENLCTDHRAHAAVITMLYSGIRPQEAKALVIDRDVDFETGIIILSEFAHLKNPYSYEITKTGKTDRAARVIPLLPPVRRVLEGKSGYLITDANGNRVNVQAWKCLWASYKSNMEEAINGMPKRWYGKTREHRRILAAGGSLPEWVEFTVTPYDLRHSFCTMLRDADPPVEINTVIHWMGHADAKMVLQVYDQYSEERGRQEAQKLIKWMENMQDNMQRPPVSPEDNDNPTVPDP